MKSIGLEFHIIFEARKIPFCIFEVGHLNRFGNHWKILKAMGTTCQWLHRALEHAFNAATGLRLGACRIAAAHSDTVAIESPLAFKVPLAPRSVFLA
jgi:hypothetical protein